VGQFTHMMSNYNNEIALKCFKFSLLNIHKIKGQWYQNGQHPTCPPKHKYISKNQILLYHQAQHSGLIGFQTLIPS
jgi:hypothetical protein